MVDTFNIIIYVIISQNCAHIIKNIYSLCYIKHNVLIIFYLVAFIFIHQLSLNSLLNEMLYLSTPSMTLACGGSPIFPLVVNQPASPSF